MSAPVKKPYKSTLRTAQARATRRAIVDAAARLFIEHGYGATTVNAIAEAAGVSRKTVFTSVSGKVEALKLAIDWAVAGDDEPVPLIDRPHVKAAHTEPDARRILADYARNVREISARIARSTPSSRPPPDSTPRSARSPRKGAPSEFAACASSPRASPTTTH